MHPVVTDSAFVLILGTFLILGTIIMVRLFIRAPEAPDWMDSEHPVPTPRKLAQVRYRNGVPFISVE